MPPRAPTFRRGIAVGGVLALAGVFVLLWWDAWRRSYWLDELLALHLFGEPRADWPSRLRDWDFHPPLYYALLERWTYWGGTSEVWVRSLSMLIFAGTTACLGILARQRFGTRAAWIAVALFVVSFGPGGAALNVRDYALMNLFFVAAWLLAEQAVRHPHWMRTCALALALAGACYSFYFGVIACLALVVALLGTRRPRPWKTLTIATVLATLLFLPWMPSLLHQIQQLSTLSTSNNTDLAYRFGHVGGLVQHLLVHRAPWGLLQAWGWPLTLLVLGALWTHRDPAARKTGRFLVVFLIVSTVIITLVGVTVGFVQPRYTTWCSAIWAVATGAALLRLPARAAWGIAAMLIVISIVDVRHDQEDRRFQDYRTAVADIVARAQPGDVVVVFVWYTRPAYAHYTQGVADAPPYVSPPFDWREETPGHPYNIEPQDRKHVLALTEKHRRIWILGSYETSWGEDYGGALLREMIRDGGFERRYANELRGVRVERYEPGDE